MVCGKKVSNLIFRLLLIVVLPIGVRNLGLHILIKCLMSPIVLLLSKFVISAI